MKIGYALKRLFHLDFGRTGEMIRRTAEKSGKNRLWIVLDMIYSGFAYGAGPNDYELFEFYNLPHKNRKTYITRGVNNALVKKFNDKAYWHYFDNKDDFNRAFAKFVSRHWVTTRDMTEESFADLFDSCREIIYKPIDGTCGKQVEKYVTADQNREELFQLLKGKPSGIVEEVVVQHPEMAAVYPLSVNTVRVVTIFQNGVCTPVFAFWRIGAGGACVDNLNSGGMAAMLDLKDGRITLPAADKNGVVYEKHPYTGHPIVGFRIPCWDRVLETVDEASRVIPQVGYVGWDVCVREKDILLIEGNAYPGHDILQLPAYTPDKIGLMSRVEKFYRGEKE